MLNLNLYVKYKSGCFNNMQIGLFQRRSLIGQRPQPLQEPQTGWTLTFGIPMLLLKAIQYKYLIKCVVIDRNSAKFYADICAAAADTCDPCVDKACTDDYSLLGIVHRDCNLGALKFPVLFKL